MFQDWYKKVMAMTRPTIGRGDSGSFVVTVQECLVPNQVDGDFGPNTEDAVKNFQRNKRLDVDGVVGPATWDALEKAYSLPFYPPPLAPPLNDRAISMICSLANASKIADYAWRDRGQAPQGYIEGMAVAWSTIVRNFLNNDSSAIEMAKANTHNASKDALSWYADVFDDFDMDNSEPGLDTLRHLFVLQLGLGMRESSGQHCCGRDMSASNVSSDTAEAGLFQMSWNASTCSEEMLKLFDQFDQVAPCDQCNLEIFKKEVGCSQSDWSCYGSGAGYRYQEMAKSCPQFAVETAAIGLRNLRQHWGPINRYEAEVKQEADELFEAIQRLIIDTGAIA
jgi:hypothetical protein